MTIRHLTPAALALVAAVACGPRTRATPGTPTPVATTSVALLTPRHSVVPAPASLVLSPADSFTVDSTTVVAIDAAADAETERIATWLAGTIGQPARPAPVRLTAVDTLGAGGIRLRLDPARTALGEEGYELEVRRDGVTLVAARPAGLFYGAQTIRQLLPASVEHPAAFRRVLRMPAVRITDTPRFAWRGAMLDVARHFLPAEDVKRYVDLMALYKLNRLHLHLADDQGWRIEIKSWPNLTTVGGSSSVGGLPGGFYTQAQYADIVAYAQSRYVTIVPEIDMPSHINAALASYPALNCDGVAPPLYTGINVGFSLICVEKDSSWKFIGDVVREIGALTPGAYYHMGGDEVAKLAHAPYLQFVERVQGVVRASGKRMIAWGEASPAALDSTSVVQSWRGDSSFLHAARGGRVILSPGKKMYIDMKYDSTTILGLRWAGIIEVRDTYDWDPATFLPGVPEPAILGLEAPLWAETLVKRSDYEFMAFPRLAAIAEVAWTPQAGRAWEDFRLRMGAQGPRLQALGVNFYRSPQIPWQAR